MRPVRVAVAVLALLAFTTGAAAADAPSADYEVLSLLGDRLLAAGSLTSIGSLNSKHEFIDLDDPLIDGSALLTVKEAVARIEPAATVALLRSRSAELFSLQAESLGSHGGAQSLADALRPRLESIPARRLLLVSKLRRGTILHFANGYYERGGRLEGLGFYTDKGLHVKNPETGEPQSGFVGVFAYFRVSLVETATWRVVREVEVAESRIYGERNKEPWDSLSAKQKVQALQALVREELARAVGRVIP